MSWDDYRLFLQVVRAGSFRAAARALATDHAAISRRVARLEDELGVKLLHRRPRGLEPTDAGAELVTTAEVMEKSAQHLSRQLSSRDTALQGWVRVSSNVPVGLHLLMPACLEFTAAHPDINLDVRLSQSLADLASNDADVAVRVALTPPEDSIARRICGFAVAVYASTPAPDSWIGWDPEGPYEGFADETNCVDLPIRHRFTDDIMMLEAAKNGLGATVLPCFLGDAEPSLHRLGDPHLVSGLFILRHSDHRLTARIRAFVDVLASGLEREADLVEGQRPSA